VEKNMIRIRIGLPNRNKSIGSFVTPVINIQICKFYLEIGKINKVFNSADDLLDSIKKDVQK